MPSAAGVEVHLNGGPLHDETRHVPEPWPRKQVIFDLDGAHLIYRANWPDRPTELAYAGGAEPEAFEP